MPQAARFGHEKSASWQPAQPGAKHRPNPDWDEHCTLDFQAGPVQLIK
jgi:hypothetical protein